MKKFLNLILCLSILALVTGCSPKEQTATYEKVESEEGLYILTDVQTLNAKGDKVYEILETTSLDFTVLDEESRNLMIEYYDETVAAMQEKAPSGVEVSASYEEGIYILKMNLYLEEADIQNLIADGYMMGIEEGDDMSEISYISFKDTCEGLESSGYIKK